MLCVFAVWISGRELPYETAKEKETQRKFRPVMTGLAIAYFSKFVILGLTQLGFMTMNTFMLSVVRLAFMAIDLWVGTVIIVGITLRKETSEERQSYLNNMGGSGDAPN